MLILGRASVFLRPAHAQQEHQQRIAAGERALRRHVLQQICALLDRLIPLRLELRVMGAPAVYGAEGYLGLDTSASYSQPVPQRIQKPTLIR